MNILKKILELFHVETLAEKQAKCPHINTVEEISEWHQNGQPDRWRTNCLDCGKRLAE